jgi:hypothetical protein
MYDLVHENGEEFSSSKTFSNFDELFHHISFIHLQNMQVAYGVDEVRIAEVFIQGLSSEETSATINHLNNIDQPLLDFGLYRSEPSEAANG